MSLNPVHFAKEVIENFLNYQLTAFPITDADLARQAREMLKKPLGQSPLIKGPYVSLSKSFKTGADLRALAQAGTVHPALPGLSDHSILFAHQSKALTEIQAGRHCLIATGTGSGKTESFLFPILDHCLKLRDQNAPEGVVAVLVYPMNALAQDQLGRLRRMLAGSGITFGMYVGSTPTDTADLGDHTHLPQGLSRADYDAAVRQNAKHARMVVSPWEECVTEKQMAEHPPRILLTNVYQLELLLTRGKDLGMFIGAPLRFLVFDEAHTYSGAVGAEVACLIRRLRSFCGKGADEVVCVATSATVTDPKQGDAAGTNFASRFFGVERKNVRLIQEEYQEQDFPKQRYAPQEPFGDTVALLERILESIEGDGNVAELRVALKELTGADVPLTAESWRTELFEHFKTNQYVWQIYHFLNHPSYLPEAVQRIGVQLKRRNQAAGLQPQAELLAYLALGAAAEKDGNVLLRPKVHFFVRGLEGAVLAFGREDSDLPSRCLRWNVEDALNEFGERTPHSVFPLSVCKTCGQHYLTARYKDVKLDRNSLTGGQAEDSNTYWEPSGEATDPRVTLTDRFITEGEDDSSERLENKRIAVWLCRACGSLHQNPGERCAHPRCKRPGKLVRLWALKQLNELSSCPSCGQKGAHIGERPIEPIRPLRATTVADVHILAQNMINAAPASERKLIVFSDNRQDAAFQAGWMQDHARRYRLRHLIYDYLKGQARPCALGDIQDDLVRTLNADTHLARALAPEVYSGRGEEAFGRGLQENLRYYLRILLVREIATAFKQRDGLEPWGLVRAHYHGLSADHPSVQKLAAENDLKPEALCNGIASLLDSFRRARYLHDTAAPIYTQYWHESAEEIQRGYLPFMDQPPKALKLTREPDDKETYVVQMISARGQTLAQNFTSKWGIEKELVNDFLKALWKFLTEDLLVPVTLLGQRRNALPNAPGVFQLSTAKIGLQIQRERYRCNLCQRVHARPTPNDCCSAMHCKGKLNREEPPADDYNIALLEQSFSMLMPEEHSAQVPAQTRAQVEADFKRPNGRTNCLVATPTLEMGVDIGDLDMVLMRNVPPKASNYWQRVGRAGRRHRMAVLFTYCRAANHDRHFFIQPEAILDGIIETPRFNLNNPVMVEKHTHAAVVSALIRLARSNRLSASDRDELIEIQKQVFPDFIKTYLFEEGNEYRNRPYDVSALRTILTKHESAVLKEVKESFAAHWPEEALSLVDDVALARIVEQMPAALQQTVNTLHFRLLWAVSTLRRLNTVADTKRLDEYELAIRRRCERFVRSLGSQDSSTYTLSVLASEGYLPGYGVFDGGVRAFASRGLGQTDRTPDFELGRAAALAVREFVPGNMLYANNGRYKVTQYHLPVGENKADPDDFVVDVEKQTVGEKPRQSDAYGASAQANLAGLPISDLDISRLSRITDEEVNRFQLPVLVLGYLRQEHRGGHAYSVGGAEIQHRIGQRTRLVNVGPADRVKKGELGFPICAGCGATRSPYASDTELGHFKKFHKETCGKEPGDLALFADSRVDGLLFLNLDSHEAALNLAEAIRLGATRVLEMGLEDLQYVAMRQDSKADLWLYDPMPGGSGILSQVLERWPEVLEAARQVLSECVNKCDTSCYGCMRNYRNSFHHSALNRHHAIEMIEPLLNPLKSERQIPAVELSAPTPGTPTNSGEQKLADLLQAAGFPAFEHQRKIEIGRPYNNTWPDLYFEDAAQDIRVAIYLDGLSEAVHGNADRTAVDRIIRHQLEALGVSVVEIASSDLDDPEAFRLQLRRIAQNLRRRDLIARL